MIECTVPTGALIYSSRKGGPTSQRARRAHFPPRNAVLSRKMAQRLDRLAELDPDRGNAAHFRKLSECVSRCATDETGWRCDKVVCPRCARRKAIRNRRRVDKLLDEPSPAAFVTLNVGTDDLQAGLRILKDGYARLRRRRVWERAVRCGIAGVEVKVSDGHADVWNVHLHALVLLRAPLESPSWLDELWEAVLEKLGAYGSAKWMPVVLRRVPVRRPPRRE